MAKCTGRKLGGKDEVGKETMVEVGCPRPYPTAELELRADMWSVPWYVTVPRRRTQGERVAGVRLHQAAASSGSTPGQRRLRTTGRGHVTCSSSPAHALYVCRKPCTQMFPAALFTIATKWNQARCGNTYHL